MSTQDYLFTSESVTEGHPDKVADQISDAVLDALIARDKKSRVACETLVTTGLVVMAGEITSQGLKDVDLSGVAREVIRQIGYTDSAIGFDYRSCAVISAIHGQSPDISQGVTADKKKDKEQGAGDQGMMFGFACDETPELMPMPISFAHRITRRLAQARRKQVLPWLRPDGKSQVTVEYLNGRPKRVTAVVVAAQHAPELKYKEIREGIIEEVVKKVIPASFLQGRVLYHINPTGRFVIGGPHGDTGLTGRKIIVDTYGGMGRHGGGAFSGKDPSKVDRSAAYMARHVAKNLVAAGLARRCEVQIAYAIGVAEPVSVFVDVHTFGTSRATEERLARLVRETFDLRPTAIIRYLKLLRPIYQKTAAYGHFGRQDPDFTWEKTNLAAKLKAAVK
ncbi:MAG: methionine adenosyltransferase [Deltaproteobacteria bacterium RBG_13_61_14]|nr:MAG: methionine adenosyltransferase [Deltaproteobacteria bacterium RBG_13_61_14]